jgi:hypothetical protein
MSSEPIEIKNVSTLTHVNETPQRVDINVLLNRVWEEKKKENKQGLVFFGLIGSVMLTIGIILSF